MVSRATPDRIAFVFARLVSRRVSGGTLVVTMVVNSLAGGGLFLEKFLAAHMGAYLFLTELLEASQEEEGWRKSCSS